MRKGKKMKKSQNIKIIKNIFCLIIFLLILVILVFSIGCKKAADDSNGGENMPMNYALSIENAELEKLSPYPPKYGLVVEGMYVLRFNMRKSYGLPSLRDSDVIMKINLPEGIAPLREDTQWTGKDLNKTLTLEIKAIKEGRWVINASAVTDEKDGFRLGGTTQVILFVEKDVQSLEAIFESLEGELNASDHSGDVSIANQI